MVIPDASHPRSRHWAELMATGEVTAWNSVPAFLQMLVEYLEVRAERPELLPRFLRWSCWPGTGSRLRCRIGCGGWRPGCSSSPRAVPTETTIWDIWNPVRRRRPGLAEHPVRQADGQHAIPRAQPPARAVPGWCRVSCTSPAPGLARGYWRDEARAERFVTHPDTGELLYLSGDIGRFLPTAASSSSAGTTAQVKIDGHRIELGEIEAALRQHPRCGTPSSSRRVNRGGSPPHRLRGAGERSAGAADPAEVGQALRHHHLGRLQSGGPHRHLRAGSR